MLIKKADDKTAQVSELQKLLQAANSDQLKKRIAEEIRIVKAGIKGEQDAAYLIDFQFANNEDWAVIHDLRIELPDGRTAQIDHLLINRDAWGYVLETKHFATGLKIEETGEFLRWNDWKRAYEGMPSPIAQNERHILALKEAVKGIDKPVSHLLFVAIDINAGFRSYILVSPNARIIRPDAKKFDSSCVVKADQLADTIKKRHGGVENMMRRENLFLFAKNLAALHRPASFDYTARFGVSDGAVEAQATTPPAPAVNVPEVVAPAIAVSGNAHKCRSCQSDNVTIQYGKFGYYFKCASCGGNTPIKIGCGKDGHKERLRKDGAKFYRECAECGTSLLYFENN